MKRTAPAASRNNPNLCDMLIDLSGSRLARRSSRLPEGYQITVRGFGKPFGRQSLTEGRSDSLQTFPRLVSDCLLRWELASLDLCTKIMPVGSSIHDGFLTISAIRRCV